MTFSRTGSRLMQFVCALSLVGALAACGSGGDGGGGGTPPAAAPLVGMFVDSPVQGLGYRNLPSGLSGLTNASGLYDYLPGDLVEFHLYGRPIGIAVPAGPVVTPLLIFGATSILDPRVVNLAQLLLTLGGIPAGTNPIQLPATRPAGLSSISFSDPNFDTKHPGLTLVSEATAITHLQANFPRLSVTLAGNGNVTSNPPGITCGATCSADFPKGAVVTLTPSGAGFAGWSGGCTGTDACVVTINANTAVTATFTAGSVRTTTVTVTKAGNGTGTVTSSPLGLNCGVTCSASLLQGPVIVTATAADGSTFAGWSAGTGNATCTGTNPCDIPLTVDSTVTATFTLNAVPVSVTANVASGNGGGGTITCSANGGAAGPCGSYLPGTAMVMTATPNSVSNFTGWSGAGCSGTSTCSFPVTAATTVTANFNRPTLTVVVAGTGTVTSDVGGINCGATCSAVLNKGTVVTVTANGTGFTGWSGGGCSGTGTCLVTLTTDTTVTASFGFGTLTVANAPASVDGTFVASGVIRPPGGAENTIVQWHELNPGTEYGETVTYTLNNRNGEVGVFFVSADGAVSATWLCAPNIVNVNRCAGVSLNRTAGTLTFVNTVLTIVPPPALPLITLNGTLTFTPF